MFPSLLIKPEMSLISPIIGYSVLTFGFLISLYRKIFLYTLFVLMIFFPVSSFSFGFVPGGCGTACHTQQNTWGNYGSWNYPPAYYYPYTPSPYSYFQNPMAYYQMLDPWTSYYIRANRGYGGGTAN
jgi:hypothetical protein